jgi:hypothetical protein
LCFIATWYGVGPKYWPRPSPDTVGGINQCFRMMHGAVIAQAMHRCDGSNGSFVGLQFSAIES